MNISIGNLGGSNPSVNELISQLVSKRTQSLNSLLEQKSSIENTLAALQSGGLGIGSLNNSYSSQIASLQDTIDRLNEQYTLNANKITTINSLKKSYNSTVTSLDKYLESLKNPNNAGKDLDIYLDGNKVSSNDKVNVTVNDKDTNIQEITLNVTQLATTSKLFSNVLIGGNVSENTLITDLFAGLYDETKNSITTNRQDIKESLKLSELGITSGSFNIGSSKITIDADTDTIGSVIQKIKDAGYNAQIVTKEFDSNGEAVGSFMISGADGKSIAITSQTTNFASQMGLTVSEGNFYINGAEFNITDTTTLGSLINDINAASADNVGAKLENGKLVFVASETGEVDINVEKGTSNFTNAIGFTVGGVMNTTNLVMGTDGSFVTLTGTKDGISSTDSVANGKFTAGNFNVYYNEVDEHGNVSDTLTKVIIEVTEDDTIESIIQKIEDQTKGSYVDEEGKTVQTGLTAAVVDGHFQIRQLQKGAEFSISVEAGSSNFTNYVGMTSAINAQTSKDAENSYVLGSVKVPEGGFSEGSFTISTNKVSDDGKTALFEMVTATITVEAGDTAESIAQKITDAGIGLTASVTEDGFFKIEQNNSGVDFDIKIEAGGTDFTYKAGLTTDIISTGVLSPGSTDLQYTSLTGSAEVDENTSVRGGTFKINGITININDGTISSAIDDINAYKDQTGVNAFLKDGHLVLQANETGPDHTLYIEGGTSNIGTVAGFLTKTETAAAATIGQNGSKSTLTGSYNVTEDSMITAGSIVINGYTINLNAGSLKDAITEINKQSSDTKVTASISNGKFVLTSTENGAVNITASAGTSNIAQVTGIAACQSQAGTQEIIGASKTTLTAAATGLKETDVIGESVISINGQKMTLSGTLKSAINTINANSGFTGVEAYLDDQGRFVFQNVNTGSKGINFVSLSGDFTRVIGAASSTTTAGSSSQVDRTPASMHGGTTGGGYTFTGAEVSGLKGGTQLFGLTDGTVVIKDEDGNSYTVNVSSTDTVNDVLDKMTEALGGIITDAYVKDGKVIIESTKELSFDENASTSNFLKLTGLSETATIFQGYGVITDPSAGFVRVTGSVSGLENGDILGGVKDGNLVLSQGSHTQTISVSSTDTVLGLINKINATADFEAGLDASGHFYIQSKHESTEAIKIDTSNAVNIDEILGLTAGTFTGSLTESLGAQGHIQVTGTVGLTPDTNNGVQTGTNTIVSTPHLTEAEAKAQGYTVIKTAQDLLNIEKNMSGRYMLVNDIDLSGYSNWNGIGNIYDGTYFEGILDGNGYTISNLKITGKASNTDYGGGLFALISGAEIRNLTIKNANISGDNVSAGALAGTANTAIIENVAVIGGSISSTTGYVGGLIGSVNGYSDSTLIENCYSTANVSGYRDVGGLVGTFGGGTIKESYSAGTVTYKGSTDYCGIGGLVGAMGDALIQDSYSTANVNGSLADAGGLVGRIAFTYSDDEATLKNSWASGKVTGSGNKGGFIGNINAIKNVQIFRCYWNTTTSGLSKSYGSIAGYGNSIYISGLTSSQFSSASNFSQYSSSIWEFTSNGPTLIDLKDTRTQVTAGTISINGTNVSISAGSIDDAIAQINAKTNTTGVVASIENNKVVFRYKDGRTDGLNIKAGSSNFVSVTGTAFTAGTVNDKVIPAANSGSGKTFTISTASTGDTFSVNITSGMTIKQLFDKINASGLYSAAFNSENKVVITALKDGMTDITFGGTSNLQSYLGLTGGGTSNVQGDLQLGTSDSYSTLTGGAIVNTDMTFSEGDFSITAGGKTETFHVAEGETITSVLNKITASDVGVSASIQNGKVVLTATTGGNVNLSIQDGTSNFVELAGFVTSGGDQIVSVVKGELATYTSQNTVETAENLGISAGDFYIHLTDADGNITDTAKIDISENEDIASIIGKINNSGLGITATVNDSGKLVLQRNSSEEAGGILVSKGSSDFTNKIGFTSGGYQAPATEYGSQSVLTSVNPISTSQKFSEGDFIISIDDNGTIRETTIDVSASDSIYDIIDKINAADAGVTASLNASNKLVITKDADTGEGSITLKKGSSDFTTIFGFTSGGIYNGTTLDGEAATHTVLVSNKLSVSGKATMASLGVTEGSFKINGVEISISSTDTIEDVIGRINTVFNDAAYKDIAVYAEYKNNQIVITTKDASSNARITIESGSTNFTEVVGFTDIGSRDNVVDMGQNAEFNIKIGDDEVGKDFSLALDLNDITNDNIYNGNNLIYLDASGNVVSSANNAAITIELKQTGETVITLGKNLLDASIIELNKFIGNFNKAMIASENEILSDDTEFAKLITNIKEALTNDVADMRKIQQQLADIGITVDIRGGMNSNMGTVRLYLDKEKYTDAFYADSQHVLDLLVGKETAIGVEDGVLTRLNNVLFPEVNNKNGYFNKVPRQLEAIQKQLKREITQTTFDLNELRLAVSGDNSTAGLSEYLEKLEEQYNFVNEAIANLNKQYATSVTRLILNQNNSGFNPIV